MLRERKLCHLIYLQMATSAKAGSAHSQEPEIPPVVPHEWQYPMQEPSSAIPRLSTRSRRGSRVVGTGTKTLM